MYQSQLFTKTRKEAPKDEISKNAQLLIKAGFINKEMAGIYSYLPLGLRVLNNINNIIREEMDKIGGQELLLSTLQDKVNWEKTNRWNDEDVDFWLKTKLKNGTELGLGATHEEPITALMKNHIRSYKDLPCYPYQIQTKFRNETRAKSGIMRCREFLMKDMYSFSKDENEHNLFYDKAKIAYKNIFKRVGLGDKTFITFASGGSFSKYSHEFQTISKAGEDTIYICDSCQIAINEEIIKEQNICPQCQDSNLRKEKAIEVGNIFSLGTKFSDALDLNYFDEKGESQKVIMGCYGVGPGRLMGTIAELSADDNGLVWPKEIAPFMVHLIEIGNEKEIKNLSQEIIFELKENKIDFLCDDRDLRPGEKFADSDLFGIPLRIIISHKTISSGEFEIKDRKSGLIKMVKREDLLEYIKSVF